MNTIFAVILIIGGLANILISASDFYYNQKEWNNRIAYFCLGAILAIDGIKYFMWGDNHEKLYPRTVKIR